MIGNFADNFNAILSFGLILIFGYLAGKAANLVKLPKVTGYITVGILLEPSFFGIIPAKIIEHSTIISNFALCVITYAIGGTLRLSKIKALGKTIPVITLLEAEMTFLMVVFGVFFALPVLSRLTCLAVPPAFYLPFALLAGALAAPTDPTPTLAVKEEYKAEGPVVTTILGIGAFDDALGIINFSIAVPACVAILGGVTGSVGATVMKPFLTIIFSLLTGSFFAGFLLLASRKVQDKGVMIVLILGSLFACYGIAQMLRFDELLSTMMLGFLVTNIGKDEEKYFISVRDYLEETIFVVFFVIAGANLDLTVLKNSLWLILVFVIMRMSGKFLGVYTGGVISGAQPKVRHYTALGLVPQGGIVVGLALLVSQIPQFSQVSNILLNLILGTTVLFEFLGPVLTEVALKNSGEAGKEK